VTGKVGGKGIDVFARKAAKWFKQIRLDDVAQIEQYLVTR